MKELVVISGKGGTGKTSLTASFAALARKAVLADCDVDAADLHLIVDARILERHPFSGGSRARIRIGSCTGCGECVAMCRFGAVLHGSENANGTRRFYIDPITCEGCGVCAWFCPEQAIDLAPATNGHWFISRTRLGPMVHARLGIAEENSGKLVSTVRANARLAAAKSRLELVLVDGPPGIGCPVIASITGATAVVAVSEPTVSGLHDLKRIASLTRHFRIPTFVCVNKWDLNPAMSSEIEAWAGQMGIRLVGRVRYDGAVTAAQVAGMTIVEYQQDGCAGDIRSVWRSVENYLETLCTDELASSGE